MRKKLQVGVRKWESLGTAPLKPKPGLNGPPAGDVGDVSDAENANVTLLGPEVLARMVFDAGLTSWLRDKVS
jgi:hypothetical protein